MQRRFRDCSGVALDAAGEVFVVSNGGGKMMRFDSRTFEPRPEGATHLRNLQWDNHLTAV